MAIYIYGLKCPIAGVIRYVGKSENPEIRRRDHINSSSRNRHHTARWIRKLLADGLEPELVIFHCVAEGERWQDIERSFIASANERGWKLTNSTAGGEGNDYLDPADKARARAKQSATLKVMYNTPERREEARLRSLKAWADPEIKSRRIASIKATYATDEMKQKMSGISQEIGSRPEVKAKKSASLKAYAADPVRFKSRLDAISSPATRSKMSASAKARFAKAGSKDYLSSPELRAKLSERAKQRATPGYRAMMSEKAREFGNRPDVKAKRSASRLALLADPAMRARLGANAITKEGHAALSVKAAARWADPEYKAKIAAKMAARWADPEYKAKIAAAKIRAANKKKPI